MSKCLKFLDHNMRRMSIILKQGSDLVGDFSLCYLASSVPNSKDLESRTR